MLKNKLYIFGGGSSAINIIELIKKLNLKFKEILIVDDNKLKKNIKKIYDINIIKSSSVVKSGSNFGVCSIAEPKLRKKLNHEIIKVFKLKSLNLIHPDAQISSNVKIGKGVIIFSGVRINHNSKIGDGCLINFNVDIGHDVKIGSNTTILTNSLILGKVSIGNQVLISGGCKIINGINIGSLSRIAFATTITESIPSNHTIKQRFDLIKFKNLN